MTKKRKWPKKHMPLAVRKVCDKFRKDLEAYHFSLEEVRANNRLADDAVVNKACTIWNKLDKRARRLLETALLWEMDKWVGDHPQFKSVDRSTFFDELRDERRVNIPSTGMAWGRDLEAILWWYHRTGKPLGFTIRQSGELLTDDQEIDLLVADELTFLFIDIDLDLRALTAAANDLLAETAGYSDVRQPLLPRELAVLEAIPYENAVRGKKGRQIISELARRGIKISSESYLTKYIIPPLRPYGVYNRRRFGYFRRHTP